MSDKTIPHQDNCRSWAGYDCTCSPKRKGWRAAEVALSEALSARDGLMGQVRGLDDQVTQQAEELTALRKHSVKQVELVTQQDATIRQLTGALEKIAAVLAGNGTSVGYESSAGLRIAEAALGVAYKPQTPGDDPS